MTYEEMNKELSYSESICPLGILPFGSKMFELEIKDLNEEEQNELRQRYNLLHKSFELNYAFREAARDLMLGRFEDFCQRLKHMEEIGRSYMESNSFKL